MKMIAVSIKDLGAQLFSRPMYVNHTNQALRSFIDEVNRPPATGATNDLFSHPDDFELYALAEFDDHTGAFLPYDRPELIAQAKSVRQKEAA